MKRIHILFLYIFISGTLCAQTPGLNEAVSFDLDDQLSGMQNFEYVARDNVTLLPGFNYNPYPNSSFSFSASIDEELIFAIGSEEYVDPAEVINQPINQSKEFGTLPGAVNVTDNGIATYNIPIATPPGKSGIEPAIAINYASTPANGIIGIGWTLSGSSAISRTGKSWRLDGSADGISFSRNDELAINGQRMIRKTGSQGYSGSVYETEIKDFNTITAYGDAGNGPQYFIVTAQNGTQIEYGNTADSRVTITGNSTVLSWKINKVTDKYGNYMTYEYLNEQEGVAYLKSVKYTGNTGASVAPYNEIKLLYQEREDIATGYIHGSMYKSDKLLRKIKVLVNNNTLRQYDFNYHFEAKTYLSEIILSNSLGEELNSTKIEWNESGDGIVCNATPISLDENEKIYDDFNNDGYTDYAKVVSSPSSLKLYINNKSGGFTEYIQSNSAFNGTITLKSGDFNGDGQRDIVLVADETCTSNSSSHYFNVLFLSLNGTSFTINKTIPINQDCSSNTTIPFTDTERFIVGDFNGDGIDDFTIFGNSNSFVLGNKNWSSLATLNVNFPYYPGTKINQALNQALNFDGDNKLDYVTKINGNFYIYELTASNTLGLIASFSAGGNLNFLGDINADKIDDLIYYDYTTSQWYIRYGTGTTFAAAQVFSEIDYVWEDYIRIPKNYILFFPDINGDGYNDFAEVYDHPSIDFAHYIRIKLNNGDGTFTVKATILNVDRTNDYSRYDDLIGDFNADGNMDFTFLLDDYQYFSYSYDVDSKRNYVAAIENGIGIRTEISYDNIAQNNDNVYSYDYSGETPVVHTLYPFTVVSSINTVSTLNADKEIANISFAYENALMHTQGNGFLGFEKVVRTNNTTGNIVELEKELDTDLYFLQAHTNNTYYQNTNNLIATATTTSMSKQPFTLAGGTNYFVYYTGGTKTDLNNNTITYTNSYNTSTCNLDYSIEQASDGAWKKITYSNYVKNGSFLPRSITKTTKHPDDANNFVVSKTLTYNSNYKLTNKVENDGLDTEVSTSYTNFDAFGNARTVTATPLNLTAVVSSYTYDATRRFVTSVTANNMTNTKTYNDYGLLLTETDYHGNTTSYQYDNWDKASTSNLPFNNYVHTETNWNVAGDYLSKTTTTASNAPYSETFTDYMGRVVRSKNEGFWGAVYSADVEYNDDHTLKRSSLPYTGSASHWTSQTYEPIAGRVSTITHATGALTSYTYNSNQLVTTVNGESFTSNYSASGSVTSVENNLGMVVDYEYYSHGGQQEVTAETGIHSATYYSSGLLHTSTDPSMGTSTYQYNSLGQLTHSEDEMSNEYTFGFDSYHRATGFSNDNNGGDTKSIQYVAPGKPEVETITRNEGGVASEINYTYDSYGRVVTESHTIAGVAYGITYDYNNNGQLEKTTDSDNNVTEYTYSNRGFLTQVEYNNAVIYQLTGKTLTQKTENYGSNITLVTSRNELGYPESIKAGSLIDIEYVFDHAKGNLSNRVQKIYNTSGSLLNTYTETFAYDDADRLTSFSSPAGTFSTGYETSGSAITNKFDAGATYNTGSDGKLHSIHDAAATLSALPDQDVSYTSFHKTKTITQGIYEITYCYGVNNQRVKMEVKQNNAPYYTRYYYGNYEYTSFANGTWQKVYYLSGSNGIIGFHKVTSGGENSIYYLLTDYQGSVMTVANAAGNAVEFFSYDPWGRRRNATNWTYNSVASPTYTTRGYTGHEHIDEISLINMNGRLYDPIVGMFLSPDPFIQNGANPLNYNRYSYVLNNPLKYTDPSGYQTLRNYLGIPTYDNGWYRVGGSSGGGGGGHISYWSRPGVGGNGTGLNGIYYDYSTNTYRSTSDGSDVGWGYATTIAGYYGTSPTREDYGKILTQVCGYKYGILGGSINNNVYGYYKNGEVGIVTNYDIGGEWVVNWYVGLGSWMSLDSYMASTGQSAANGGGNTANDLGSFTEYTGIINQIGGYTYYSDQLDSWVGLKNLSRNKVSTFNGNQYTGGRNISKKISNRAVSAGKWLGRVDYVTNTIQLANGSMSQSTYYLEQGSNVVSDVLPGIYGVAWSVGWEGGRLIVNTSGYQYWKAGVIEKMGGYYSVPMKYRKSRLEGYFD